MSRLFVLTVILAVFLTGRLAADEVFYGVKIRGNDYYVNQVWDALNLIMHTSAPTGSTGQNGWWTLVKRSGVRTIQLYTYDTYGEYSGGNEDYSRVPGGFVKGGELTIYLLEDDWTDRQYAEMIIHETVHVMAGVLRNANRKAYRKMFGDYDGEEVYAEKLVDQFRDRLSSDDLSRRIESYTSEY